jgi:hypothetical protein
MTSGQLIFKPNSRIMKTFFKTLFAISMIFVLNSCALRPITSSYDYQKNKSERINIDNLGNGRILIYNGANGLHKIDNTASLNMWINEKPMGQVRASEYAIIELEIGTYEFKLLHVDMFNFKSYHKIEINEKTKVIRIEPTITSNDLTITNQLPTRFDKFRYVENR